MENLENLIDPTHFGTVRHYLHSAHSPITMILLVRCRALLSSVAAALLAEDGRSDDGRRQQWTRWLLAGDVRIGTHSPTQTYEADLDAIPKDTRCQVLYLPPIYLVCLGDDRPTVFTRIDD